MREELDSLSCPTELGQITILPGHIPLVANLAAGELVARSAGKEHFLAVTGGFIEVKPNNEVIALADAAEHADKIDEKRAEEAIARAKLAMGQAKEGDMLYADAAAALERSLTRLRIARKRHHNRPPITGGQS